jgi:hypothetical protein
LVASDFQAHDGEGSQTLPAFFSLRDVGDAIKRLFEADALPRASKGRGNGGRKAAHKKAKAACILEISYAAFRTSATYYPY